MKTLSVGQLAQAFVYGLLLAGYGGVLAGCNPLGRAWPEPAQAASGLPARAAVADAGPPAVAEPQQQRTEQKAASRRPPKLPHSSRRACGDDRDCVIVPPRPCVCPECGDSWHEVLNRGAVKKLKAGWAIKKCVQRPCPKCESRLLGRKAICDAGQCTVE